MSDYAPPSGPPPPKVPEGWKALWNQQYSEWYYVNLHTKASQWDRPTQPAYPASPSAPAGPPPSYAGSGPTHAEKSGEYGSNNPYTGGNPNQSQTESDAAYAARLQAEEEERARHSGGRPTSRGAADTYYQQGQTPQPGGGIQGGYPGAPGSSQGYPDELPPREQKSKGLGGLLSKLSGKSSSSSHYQGGGYPQQQGYPPQQGGYGGYPPQQGYGGGGYPPQQGYGGYPPQGGYGGGGYGAPPRKSGMGAGGAAALGLGGGLLGGALLADAMGGDDGGDGGGYGGGDDGDYGGDGGGDFGGD
ncbi:MAG: hypothetical protein LQ338_001604 [Usnochroma carphineum]|nr:MAG: hypothetical protein LQ338_001604 [Usnochroma carphineum]